MRLGIRGKLFAVSFGLIILSLLAGELYLRPSIEANLLDRIRADLFVRLALVERAAAARTDLDRAALGRAGRRPRAARPRTRHLHRRGGHRDRRLRGRARRPRHASRTTAIGPRSRRRWRAAQQSSMRFSATIQKRLMYAAIPMALPGGGRGAARLAVPLDEVDAAVGAVRHILWGALVVALVVALVASTTVAQLLSRALRRMTDAARRMAAGDLAVRLRPPGTDEIAELGRALDTMATSLAATLTALRGERDLLGLILESMREGVLVLDQQGRILLVNPALRATLGIPADTEGRAALELIRNAELPSILERARSGGRPGHGRDRDHRTAAAAAAGPRRAAADGQRQAPGAARRVRRRHRDAAAGDAAQGLRRQRVARAAHPDHRRALGGRHPAADAGGRPEPRRERFVDIIDRNAQRLGALVEDLLDLSRIESKDYLHPCLTIG